MDISTMTLGDVEGLTKGVRLNGLMRGLTGVDSCDYSWCYAMQAIGKLERAGRTILRVTFSTYDGACDATVVHLDEGHGDDAWAQHEVWSASGDDWALTICKGIVAWAIARRESDG